MLNIPFASVSADAMVPDLVHDADGSAGLPGKITTRSDMTRTRAAFLDAGQTFARAIAVAASVLGLMPARPN